MSAGHAIMQGKLVLSQSRSTFLFLNRFSMRDATLLSPTHTWLGTPQRCEERHGDRTAVPRHSLLTQGEVCFRVARHRDGLRLVLDAFVPRCYGVAAVGNVFDLVAPDSSVTAKYGVGETTI